MEFTTPDVVKIIDVNRNRLQVWLDKGWIAPSLQKAKGYGGRNLFSKDALYRISLFKWLVESGLSRNLVGAIFKLFGKYDFAQKPLTTDNCWFDYIKYDKLHARYRIRFGNEKQEDLNLDNVRYIFSVNMTKIIDEVDKNIKKMGYQKREAQKQGDQ